MEPGSNQARERRYPISGILTRLDTYQRVGGEGELDNKAGKMTYLAGQQASKCDVNHGSPLSRDKRRPLTGIELTLTLLKLHLATCKF